ncbi:MAG TPA: prolipoprotein diacylglyceryl transferase [Candidatus Limnocylindrales bacterium]
MIDFTPNPIAVQIGPLPIHWYGIAYAVGIAVAAWLATREARRRGQDPSVIPDGIIVIAIAALIGGRAYHVIDQWHLYADDPIRIFLPPYTGLGIYGGVATGLLAMIWYTRRKGLPFWLWADIAAPAVLITQAIARWGNFFNQELYGPPTSLPWGIAIQCQNRVQEYLCPPLGTTPVDAHFHPLFLYESLLSFLGVAVLLFVGRRFAARLRRGDVAMGYFIWYGVERFLLEFFRSGYNWTFFGIPTAQLVASGFIVGALAVLAYRHRPGARREDRAGAVGTEPGTPPGSAAVDRLPGAET